MLVNSTVTFPPPSLLYIEPIYVQKRFHLHLESLVADMSIMVSKRTTSTAMIMMVAINSKVAILVDRGTFMMHGGLQNKCQVCASPQFNVFSCGLIVT